MALEYSGRIEGDPLPAQWEETTPEARHLGLLYLTPELFLALVKRPGCHYYEVTDNAIPDDATLVGCTIDAARGAIVLKIEHPSFARVEPGQPIPELPSPVLRSFVE